MFSLSRVVEEETWIVPLLFLQGSETTACLLSVPVSWTLCTKTNIILASLARMDDDAEHIKNGSVRRCNCFGEERASRM
jgi:hypothetical protein